MQADQSTGPRNAQDEPHVVTEWQVCWRRERDGSTNSARCHDEAEATLYRDFYAERQYEVWIEVRTINVGPWKSWPDGKEADRG